MEAKIIISANQSVMNSEHINARVQRSCWVRWFLVFIATITGMAAAPKLAMSSAFRSDFDDRVQGTGASIDADFASTVSALANTEPGDTAGIDKLEKKALGILDSLVISALAGNVSTDLDPLNAHLANLGSQERGFGESYRVVKLGGKPIVFALVGDFGLGAPSAIRLYAQQGSPAHVALAGEIDRLTQKDMLDDSLELLPVPLPETASDVIFVTVAGRTDELQTGVFAAWRFDGKQLTQLWTTDLISHSTFEISGGNLVLTYCHDPAEQDAKTCQGMVREKYAYTITDGQWKQVSTEPVANPKH
ncbi:MAG: hypothetical protein WB997_13300 [Candidatus Acidiferrales bacterium]